MCHAKVLWPASHSACKPTLAPSYIAQQPFQRLALKMLCAATLLCAKPLAWQTQ